MNFRDFVQKAERNPKVYAGVLVLIFLAVFGLCSLIGYSDGDDAYFREAVQKQGCLDFLTMRYKNWSGRLAAELTAYIVFSLPLIFWRIINALAFCLLIHNFAQIFSSFKKGLSPIAALLIVSAGIASLGFHITGWACFWITGSLFYLWPAAAASVAARPFICSLRQTHYPKALYFIAIPMLIYAGLAQEQIAGALFLLILASIFCTKQNFKTNAALGVLLLTCIVIMLKAPGNAIRYASEQTHWFPALDMATIEDRISFSLQWLLNGLAHETVIPLLAICTVFLTFRFYEGTIRKRKAEALILTFCSAGAILTALQIPAFTDFGFSIDKLTTTPISENILEEVSKIHLPALILQGVLFFAISSMLFLHSKGIGILFLAAIGTSAVVAFSPTLYASAGRVFFVTGAIFSVLPLYFLSKIKSDKIQWGFCFWVIILTGFQSIKNYAAVTAYLSGN